MKKNKIIVMICLFILLSLITMSCDKEKDVADGFNSTGDCDGTPDVYIAYSFKKAEHNIDEIQVDISYGWVDQMHYDEIYDNICVNLIIYDEKKMNDYIVLKEIKGFNDLEYICHILGKKVQYNHSERIVVPKELFCQETGRIGIAIVGVEDDGYWPDGGYIYFKYSLLDNMVKIIKD